jgi:hypothetical protein
MSIYLATKLIIFAFALAFATYTMFGKSDNINDKNSSIIARFNKSLKVEKLGYILLIGLITISIITGFQILSSLFILVVYIYKKHLHQTKDR